MAWIQVTSNPFDVSGNKAGSLRLRRRANGNVPAGLVATADVLPRAITSIAIEGPSQVNEGAGVTYQVRGTYANGTTTLLTSGLVWSDNAPGGVLTIPTDNVYGNDRTVTVMVARGALVAQRVVQVLDTTSAPQPDPGPANSLAIPAGTISSGVYDKQQNYKLVRSLASAEKWAGGTYIPRWDGRNDAGVLLPYEVGRYVVKTAGHQAATDTESILEGQIGQSCTEQYSVHTRLGLNIVETLSFVGSKALEARGFAEGGPDTASWPQETPNYPTTLRVDDKFSGVRSANNSTRHLLAGFLVYAQSGYRGRGIIKVNPATNDYEPWAEGGLAVETQHGPYSLIDTKLNDFTTTIVAANDNYIYAVRPTETVVYSVSGAYQQTLPFGGLAAVCNATDFWLGGDDNRIRRYTITGDNGGLIATDRVAGLNLTAIGQIDLNRAGTRLVATNIAAPTYPLAAGQLRVGGIYTSEQPDYSVQIRTYQGPADQSHTLADWQSIWAAEGSAGGANFAYKRTICESTADHDVHEYDTATGQLVRSLRALHNETGDYGTDATVTGPYKLYLFDTRRPLNGGGACFAKYAGNNHLFVNDFGNSQVLHFDENWNLVADVAQQRIVSLGTTSNIAGNRNKPEQVWQLLQMRLCDLSKKPGEPGGERLAKNYSAWWEPGDEGLGLRDMMTFPNGEDYGCLRAGYKRQLVHITPTRLVRELLLPGDLGANLDADGSATCLDGYNAPQSVLRYPLSFNAQGRPQYVDPPVAAGRKLTRGDNELQANGLAGSRTKSGIRFFYNPGGAANYNHLALLRPLSSGETDFFATTLLPLSRDYPAGRDYFGTYPLAGKWYMNASGTQYQGSFIEVLAEEEMALTGEKMEFFLGGAQTNLAKLTDKWARVLLTIGEVRYPAYKYGPYEKFQGGNGDTAIVHRVGNDLLVRIGAELGNGIAQARVKNLFSTLVEYPELEPTIGADVPLPGRNLLAAVPRYKTLANGDGGLLFTGGVTVDSDREFLTPAGGAPDLLVHLQNNGDSFRIPFAAADLGFDKPNWTLFFSLAYKSIGDDNYYVRACSLRDEADKVAAQLRRTTDGVSTTQRLNSVAAAFTDPSGGITLNQKLADVEVREVYYYQPFVLRRTPAGLTLTSRYGTVPFELKDPAANALRPAALTLDFTSFGNGAADFGLHDVRFLIS